MRNLVSEKECDIERMVAAIGAPPVAPMNVVRQQLEHEKGTVLHGLLPRLREAFMPKAGQ